MVGWYDPAQLAKTAARVVVSTFFASNADNRLIESLTWGENVDADYAGEDETWIDYTADTGDGFDSTYAVAYWMTRAHLGETKRGSIVIFGGDEVYPAAGRDEYKSRLVEPYAMALTPAECEGPPPHLFAIPGNHDWYDSLVAFSRLFGAHDFFAGTWATPQTRSYFALSLPHGWWLIGTDIQLGADIDAPQLDYFRQVAARMKEGDRVILCNAEPYWIQAHRYAELDPKVRKNNLDYLMQKIFPDRVRVVIAGDSHHYRHHVGADGSHRIVAGGGGAFLHLTNGTDVNTLRSGDRLAAQWPTAEESRKLAWRNLLFPFINPKLGLFFTGPLYAFVGLAVAPTVDPAHPSWPPRFTTPAIFLLCSALIVLLLVLFTETHSKIYRRVAGSIHGLLHVALLGAAMSLACTLGYTPFGYWNFLRYLAITYAAGAVVAPFILGIYLLVSLNVFGRHGEDASASLRIADWKNFLRLHVAKDGSLTIFPFGIRRVPRQWTNRGGKLHPDGGSEPELIEDPIVIR